jgi:divalent metal cation (Fe/Co/Zn/Cd) transporter
LLLGAYAIGAHSYTLLEQAAPSLPFSIPYISSSRSQAHTPSDSLPDPNAAWIAVFSIIVKESIYRITASVARSENSPVLLANALHHRSDMYSSFVSLAAILGNWFLPSWPLDPFGGADVACQGRRNLSKQFILDPQVFSSLSSFFTKHSNSSAPPSLS